MKIHIYIYLIFANVLGFFSRHGNKKINLKATMTYLIECQRFVSNIKFKVLCESPFKAALRQGTFV